jgi:hypothetical protein
MGNLRSEAVAAICYAVVGASALVSLAGCPTVDLGDTPTEVGLCNPNGGVQYFQDHIWPEFIENKNNMNTGNCAQAGCHINGGNGLDFPGTVDYPAFYRRTQIYLNCGTPEASELLTKPLAGPDAHSGGDIFQSVTDPAVVVFLNWFK